MGESQRNQTSAKKCFLKGKKFLLLRPIPSTSVENPQNRQICKCSQDCGAREGCRRRAATPAGSSGFGAGLSAAAGWGIREPLRPGTAPQKTQSSCRQQYLRAPPGSPKRRRCASCRLPFPSRSESSLPRARALSPSPLPERGGQMRSLGEKNVSARTIPFSPPAARCSPGLAPFSLALPRAPRLSRPTFPSQQPRRAPSVAIIHGLPGDRR